MDRDETNVAEQQIILKHRLQIIFVIGRWRHPSTAFSTASIKLKCHAMINWTIIGYKKDFYHCLMLAKKSYTLCVGCTNKPGTPLSTSGHDIRIMLSILENICFQFYYTEHRCTAQC